MSKYPTSAARRHCLDILAYILKAGHDGVTMKELIDLFSYISEDTIKGDIRYMRDAGFDIQNSFYPDYVYTCENVILQKK